MEDEDDQLVPDWAVLPSDVLQRVYEKIFEVYEGRSYKPKQWPLKRARAQVGAICLVCKHWHQAMIDRPPALHLEIQTPREYLASKWMTSFPVKSLAIGNVVPYAPGDASDEEEQQINLSGDSWYGIGIDCVHARFDGLCIGQLIALEKLFIQCPSTNMNYVREMFNADPLRSLQHLSELTLNKFTDFNLVNLPLSLRELNIYYRSDGPDGSDTFDMVPRLPENLLLDQLILISRCILGISLEELWNSCKVVKLLSAGCLVGVPVPDPEVIRVFERPYREGRYVPPHILGDGVALEASSRAADSTLDYMLKGIASSSQLDSIKFIGDGAQSLKLVPGTVGNVRSHVEFLQRVCKHKTMYLYGVSRIDVINRLKCMITSRELPASALEIEREPRAEDFLVRVKNRMVTK